MFETTTTSTTVPVLPLRTLHQPGDSPRFTTLWDLEEELVNCLTHGLGLGLSIAGFVGLVVLASTQGTVWHVIASVIFGTSLVLVYLASTVYHAVQNPRIKRILRLVDCIAIYLLIAGTYTPFTLITLRGPWGWALFGTIWCMAAMGIVFMVLVGHRHDRLSLGVYLAMGWVSVFAMKPIIAAIPVGGLLLLVGGGLAYTVGTVFYSQDTSCKYFHAVWHLFVMLGSLLHFFAVYYYVLPVAI